ncbi:MAG: MotA/TolQ/ExbB proton channel family protein [Lentisphaerae bacterium]|nr:MotA/TolQ/ExbB proton channel family protein [Lentisphaerota bacterium]
MHDLTLYAMLKQGWPIISLLLVCSIVSFSIILDRFLALRNARLDARQFVEAVLRDLAMGGLERAMQRCQHFRKPVSAVVAEVLNRPGSRDDKERAMQHAIQEQLHLLEHRVAFLGTVGSTAPFIGLLGTVIGIIKAFKDIAANAGGGPDVVSAGIAEALVTTAFGLVVAIPAVMAYNYFVNALRRFSGEMEMAVYDVIETQCREERL